MSNAKKNKEVRQLVRRTFRVLEMDKEKQYIVLIKQGTGLADHRSIEYFANAMAHSGVNGVVCVVDEFDNLSLLDEKGMNKLGWYYHAPDEPEPTPETHQNQQDYQGEEAQYNP